MALLRVKINGEPGAITARAFLSAVQNTLDMLRDYDTAISGESGGSLQWLVTDLSIGSLCVGIESESLVEDRNVGPEVVEQLIKGWSLIEHQGVTPPLLSEQGMARAKNIVRLIGRGGMTGLHFSTLADEVEVSVEAAPHIDRLLRVTYKSIGSVEGRIETLSIHGKARFIIYHSRTRKAVTCRVSKEQLLEMVPTAMMGHRVSVHGVVYSNARGEPLRIDPQRIRVLRPDSELPSRASLSGSDPNFTGDKSSEEYVRDMRSG